MAETLVKDQVCNACGSEIRPHSLFCYHCGGALQAEDFPKEKNDENEQDVSDAWFRDDLTENQTDEKEESVENRSEIDSKEEEKAEEIEEEDKAEEIEEDDEIEKPTEDLETVLSEKKSAETLLDDDAENTESEQDQVKSKPFEENDFEKPKTDAKLMTASALRNRSKPSRLKLVEIQWEERESSPNLWFIIIALVLVGLAGALIYISFYLK